MKVLFTSVGRRVELMQAFRAAATKIGIDLVLIGADITETAPALSFCDRAVLLPRIDDPAYIPFLRDYCMENGIDALVPTIDTDLRILAESKQTFGDTVVVISDPDRIAICRDKRLTGSFFESVGLRHPATVDDYTKYDGGFPAFIKPKDGSSSINAYKVDDPAELEGYCNMVPDYIIQPYVSGTEFTVDVMCDFEGNPIFITPRIRLAVRSGEVLKTRICQDLQILTEMESLVSSYRPCGPITVQLIRDERSGEDYYIEINPRFGGGAPLSMKAGADSAEALLRLLTGERIGYQRGAAEDGAVYCRYDQSVRIG